MCALSVLCVLLPWWLSCFEWGALCVLQNSVFSYPLSKTDFAVVLKHTDYATAIQEGLDKERPCRAQ